MPLPKPLPSMHDVIHHEEDTVLKNFVQITSGIQDIIGKVEMWVCIPQKHRSLCTRMPAGVGVACGPHSHHSSPLLCCMSCVACPGAAA